LGANQGRVGLAESWTRCDGPRQLLPIDLILRLKQTWRQEGKREALGLDVTPVGEMRVDGACRNYGPRGQGNVRGSAIKVSGSIVQGGRGQPLVHAVVAASAGLAAPERP
jgi:hypothetical protein